MQDILKRNFQKYLNTWKPLIFRVDLHLIWWCNFKCIMCDNWKNKVEINFSEKDFAEVILTLKKDYNCNYIRFHGQEPTLYSKLENLVLFSKKIWLKVAIKTNWWLISDSKLVKLIKFWLDELYLSIDWPDEIINDEIRGVKWAFKKNLDIIKKSKKINPNLKIYINSVILKSNYLSLEKMILFWFKYDIDRVSFVFINNKNKKDIDNINLNKKEFLEFFKTKIPIIYNYSKKYKIAVDFSPTISNFVLENTDFIISELSNNFKTYEPEIIKFYNGIYGKIFYDKYWCYWPIDHCSINYNWDMFWCCVVERSKNNWVWNILKNDLKWLWNTQQYLDYRENSNFNCSHADNCASNFYSRKKLFKSIYLDKKLYPLNNPVNYYRYLNELSNGPQEVIDNIKLNKLKEILLYFYDNLDFYKNMLIWKNIKREDILSIENINFINKLPILNKQILKQNIEEIYKLKSTEQFLEWKTSWNSWDRLGFRYPFNFKRFIKQISIFSKSWNYIYEDSYFSITPINCNQTIINKIEEPNYVNKIYINIYDFDYKKENFLLFKKIFDENKKTKTIYWDSKYLLFIILWFKKYWIDLPKIDLVSISYSYTPKSLKNFIKKAFNSKIIDSFWCSEVWPISFKLDWKNEIFWDNLIVSEDNNDLLLTDLDNYLFPFINYNNWDIVEIKDEQFTLLWKKIQQINWLNLKDLDDYFFNNFSDIIFFQFDKNNLYIVWWNYDLNEINMKIYSLTWKKIIVKYLKDNFFIKWDCSKFKIIN